MPKATGTRGNPKKLKPIRSVREACEKGKKGGKKSGEVRRARKTLAGDLLSLLGRKDDDGNNFQAKISASLIAKAVNGDTRAFEIIRDTIGEKPVERVEANVNNGENQALLKKYLEMQKKEV